MPRYESPESLHISDPSRVLDLTDRVPYAPTPLSPWDLITKTPDGVYRTYHEQSLVKFDALMAPYAGHEPDWLVDAVHTSLMSLHSSRCARNYAAYMHLRSVNGESLLEDEAKVLLEQAKLGRTTTLDLLRLYGMRIGLPAVGLAKQSHPFNWDTAAMDTSVHEAMEQYDPRVRWLERGAHRRYAYYRSVPEQSSAPHGLVLVRKRNVGIYADGSTVVKRSTFVMRMDDELPKEDRLPQDMQPLRRLFETNPNLGRQKIEEVHELLATASELDPVQTEAFIGVRIEELLRLESEPDSKDNVSRQLAQLGYVIEDGLLQKAPWLIPVATSYYIRPGRDILPVDQRPELRDRKRYFPVQLGRTALTR